MKKICLWFTLIYTFRLFSQVPVQFTSNNVFQTQYFLPNKGQFNAIQGTSEILYQVENGIDKISFQHDGFVWQTFNIEEKKEFGLFKHHEKEEDELENFELVWKNIQCKWLETESDSRLVPIEKSNHYFSYGDSQFQVFGYKKIFYKEWYKNIDVEFTIPNNGGLHYTAYLKPGSRIEDMAFTYIGDKLITKLKDDTLIIYSGEQGIVEYGLHAYYEDGTPVLVHYTLKNGRVGFEFGETVDENKTIVIDPWIKQVTSLTANKNALGYNMASDVDYDFDGNVFVYGGGSPAFKVAKYSASGTLLWTFNGSIPSISWNSGNIYPSNFVVQHNTGKVYVGQVNTSVGAKIVRLDKNGVYDNYVSKLDGNFKEVWEMATDCNNGNIFGMGGTTSSNQNIGSFDKSGNFTAINCTGISTYQQDIVSAAIDNQGNMFLLMASVATPKVDNVLFKLNKTYNAPVWSVATGYAGVMQESKNRNFYSTGSNNSNGYNALAANGTYLFYYDGKRIRAFNKSTGTPVGSDVGTSGNVKLCGGIYADECNNVYVGGMAGNLLVYNFNGSIFVPKTPLALTGLTTQRVFDVKYFRGTNLIYVCGDSFIGAVNPNIACDDTATLQAELNVTTLSQCSKKAIVKLLNYDPNSTYSYSWIDSTAGTTVREVLNSKKAADTLTNISNSHRFIVRVSRDALCDGSVKIFRFSGTKTLFNVTLCAGRSVTFNGKKYTTAGVFTDTIPVSKACDSIIEISIKMAQNSTGSQTKSACQGKGFKVGAHNYLLTGIYTDTFVNFQGCDSVLTTRLNIKPISRFTQTASVCKSEFIMAGNKKYSQPGTYSDTFVNYLGCDSILTTQLKSRPPAVYPRNPVICEGDFIKVGNHTYNKAGIYADTMLTKDGCDSLVISSLTVNLKSATKLKYSICEGESIKIGNNVYNKAGDYSEVLINNKGCDSVVTSNIAILPLPVPVITGKFSICELDHDTTLIDAGSFTSYLWYPNGQISRSILVANVGKQSVWVTNSYGCKATTDIMIINDCSPRINIPNAFTPDDNNRNELFKPVISDFKTYELLIYNRWGEILFHTEEPGKGWDGYFNNKPVQEGVYIYLLHVKGNDDLMYHLRGNFTLMR